MDVEVGWPGSVGDGRVWLNSLLNRSHQAYLSRFPKISIPTDERNGNIINEEISPFILADSAYPNTRYLVTTFKISECDNSRLIAKLNKKLGGARYHVENAFGILKGRFRILQRPLECAGEDVCLAIKLTGAIFILHNFLLDVQDTAEIESVEIEDGENPDDMEDNQMDNEDMCTRNVLIRHMRYEMDRN